VGAALALTFLQAFVGWIAVGVAAVATTALFIATQHRRSTRLPVRVLGWMAVVPVVGLHLLWLYFALSWGSVLAWTTSTAMRLAIGAALVAWLASHLLRWKNRVPLALPLGMWVAACLWGWVREEPWLRCRDYQEVVSQPGVQLLVPTTLAAARCEANQTLPIYRFPRSIWEHPDGQRYFITSQAPNGSQPIADGPLTGSICEIPKEGTTQPHCVGEGKAQGIVLAEPLGRIFVAAWGNELRRDGWRSALYTLPLDGPLRVLDVHRFEASVGDLFYVPSADSLVLFADEGDKIRRVRASTLEPLEPLSLDPSFEVFAPGELRFAPARNEGVLCGTPPGVATVVEGDPLKGRRIPGPLKFSLENLLGQVSLSWGCDFDPASRKIFSTVPNFGLLAVLNYDTGRLERTWFTGFGARPVVYDARRQRLYVGNFLRGDLTAYDAQTGAELARWSTGHYLRRLVLTHEGDALLASSNVGLLKIALPPVTGAPQ
jgi:hypothetical protein